LISDSFANQDLWITNMLDRMQLWIYGYFLRERGLPFSQKES